MRQTKCWILDFQEETNKILSLLPPKRQKILFSATLDTKNKLIKDTLLCNSVRIEIESTIKNTELIKQSAYRVEPERKGPLLQYLIKTQNMAQVLVFVSSARTTDNLTDKLKEMALKQWQFIARKAKVPERKPYKDSKKAKRRCWLQPIWLRERLIFSFCPL